MRKLIIGIVLGLVLAGAPRLLAEWDSYDYQELKEIRAELAVIHGAIVQQNQFLERQAKVLERTALAQEMLANHYTGWTPEGWKRPPAEAPNKGVQR